MTATLTETKTICFKDLDQTERKLQTYYNMPCQFQKPRSPKKHQGQLTGSHRGRLQISKGRESLEIEPEKVWIEKKDLRSPFSPGDQIEVIAFSPPYSKGSRTEDKLTVLTVLPILTVNDRSGETIKLDPFYYRKHLLLHTQELLLHAQEEDSTQIPKPPIAFGTKVQRRQGTQTKEVGEVIEWDLSRNRLRVQWPDKRTWFDPKKLAIAEVQKETIEEANPVEEGSHSATEETALKIAKIRRDGGTQPRAGLDEKTVEEYAEEYKSRGGFERIPPVITFFDGTNYWLADGFHRIAAQEKADLVYSKAIVKQGTRREAQLFSLGANAAHGLRRSHADKRRVIKLMLGDEEWKDWSDNAIAKHCKVDHKTVSRIRKEAYPTSLADTNRTFERNGKQHKMETQKIGGGEEKTQAKPEEAASGEPESAPTSRPEEAALWEPEPEPTPVPTKRKGKAIAPETREEALERPEPPPPPPGTNNGMSEAEAEALAYWQKIQDIEEAKPETKKAFRAILAKKLTLDVGPQQ